MHNYGIIGYPLTTTFSPAYFNQKFAEMGIEAQYQKFPLQNIAAFQELIQTVPNLCGINVTLPYKEQIIPFLNEIDSTAAQIGAVNTIAFKQNKTIGYNTDVIGFSRSLQPLLQPQHNKALILGTGGAAKAVAFALIQMQIDYRYVSRTPTSNQLDYTELTPQLLQDYSLIINTTPLGMAPNENTCASIPYHLLTPKHLLYDLIYQPEQTLFLQKGNSRGTVTKNGYEMLLLQAEAAWDIWQTK